MFQSNTYENENKNSSEAGPVIADGKYTNYKSIIITRGRNCMHLTYGKYDAKEKGQNIQQ